MSTVMVALVFGVGVATFVWSKLSRSTGNAHPNNLLIAAAVSGLMAFLFLLSIFKWIFNV